MGARGGASLQGCGMNGHADQRLVWAVGRPVAAECGYQSRWVESAAEPAIPRQCFGKKVGRRRVNRVVRRATAGATSQELIKRLMQDTGNQQHEF